MDDFELGLGPGGLGCIYCTKQCPNCGREVFDTDIIYGDRKTYCKHCEAEIQEEQEKVEKLEEEQDFEEILDGDNIEGPDDDLEEDLDDIEADEEMLNKFRNMSKEELDALGKELCDQIQNLYEDVMGKMKS